MLCPHSDPLRRLSFGFQRFGELEDFEAEFVAFGNDWLEIAVVSGLEIRVFQVF